MNKNMSDTLPVICENAGRTIEVAMGTTLLEVERQLRLDGPHPFLAAYVNNRIKELNYRIYKPVTVRFIDITSFEGIRVYQRTISFILQKAVRELFPDRTLYIRHSLGASGFPSTLSLPKSASAGGLGMGFPWARYYDLAWESHIPYPYRA